MTGGAAMVRLWLHVSIAIIDGHYPRAIIPHNAEFAMTKRIGLYPSIVTWLAALGACFQKSDPQAAHEPVVEELITLLDCRDNVSGAWKSVTDHCCARRLNPSSVSSLSINQQID